MINGATEDVKYAGERNAPNNHFNLEIEHFSECVFCDKQPLLTFDDANGNCRENEMVLENVFTNFYQINIYVKKAYDNNY